MMNRLRQIIQHNLWAKILALLIATILWGYVMNDQNPSTEASYTVPVTMANAPDGYQITQDRDTVRIKVRASRSLFVSADESDFKAYVDLSKAEEGTHEMKVKVDMPAGFELVDARPDTVNVTLDKIKQKKMKAEFIITGATAPGTTVAHVTQSVNEVTLEGPSFALDEVTRVIGYVGLSGNSEDFSLQVPLTAINADGREVAGVKVTPSSANVSIQLARGLTKKVVKVDPVIGTDLASGYEFVSARPDPAKIEIAGDEKTIANIQSIRTEMISLADFTQSGEKTVQLDLPDGVLVTNKEIKVRVEVKKKEKE